MYHYSHFLDCCPDYNLLDQTKINELLALPILYSIDQITPLLNKNLNYREIICLRTLLNYKYREERTLEHYQLSASLETVISSGYVNLLADRSTVINIQQYANDVKKVKITAARNCETIQTPSSLEMLDLSIMPKLTTIEGLDKLAMLKDLTINKASKFTSFHEIKTLDKLLFLNLNENKNLNNLDFLTNQHQIRFLDVIRCPQLEVEKIIPSLQKLKHLKHLNISLKKKELPLLLEALPHVYIQSYKYGDTIIE
ncbi:hypothetical protein [Myroides pelagicus]|uniref:Leucine-rich repeat domain-containing protein n=1 Tax=Myroides pelagicus TaxID=270914 RepID=A0A7K1GQF6_9FLAO|nr:hypothetical protein [Myroides pelagicus]MEC4114164.1 hypothetical protein [Myroides pelagicus]MTH31086.1 hypothetical protein [Myroides pelagicus]